MFLLSVTGLLPVHKFSLIAGKVNFGSKRGSGCKEREEKREKARERMGWESSDNLGAAIVSENLDN